MSQTVVEKIAEWHLADGPSPRPVQAGDFVRIRPRHVMTHDNTSAVMKKFKTLEAERIHHPRQPVFTLDHDIQNQSKENLAKYRSIEAFAREQGVSFHPAGEGIGHQIMVESCYVVPGAFVVASDSHSNMYGALGAVGTPIVRTDAAAVWATGEFWWQVPRTVQVVLEGSLPLGATGKDVILMLCGLYNQGEVLNAAVEFTGPGVASLSMDARFTISNMTTEWGALTGWFPVDAVTLRYLERRRDRLSAQDLERQSEEDLDILERDPPGPDPDAHYDGRIVLDLNELTPQVAGPDTVQTVTPLSEVEEQGLAIQKAYLVSCVNSRLEDLRAAAKVLAGKRVADGVELYVAAASRNVQEEAEREGIWDVFVTAGAHMLPPGCGPCIGLGTGLLEPGEVGISATNRNFKGRMGSREARCYLASPEVVAASAVAGVITGRHQPAEGGVRRRFERLAPLAPATDEVEIIEDFPASLTGRLIFLPADNLNTDGIYGKDYTYREDMTPEDMARVVMANYDPAFVEKAAAGDIVASGFNFGTGSSREQAVTALQAKGIHLVVAGSFSQTYLRNAFNNGFLCIESPAFIRRLREVTADLPREKTLVPGDTVEIDFVHSRVRWRDQEFAFPPLNRVPQELVAAGGVENMIRQSKEPA